MQHRGDVGVEVRRVKRPHDSSMHVRIGDGEAEQELRSGHALEQLVHPGVLPELPDVRGALPGAWLTAGYAAADDDARPTSGRLGNGRLVLWLEGRVRDLQHIKYAHGDVVGEVRQDGGTAQETNLACALEIV